MVIESEMKFLWRLLWDVLKTPFLFILVLFGKRDSAVLWRPVRDIWEYIIEAKVTFWLIIITTVTTIAAWFLPEQTFATLLNYPHDLLMPARWYSFITSGFIHANLAHWAGNMLALFVFGRVVERKISAAKMIGVYCLALFVSGILSCISGYGDNIPGLGASGAIMGLVSAAMLLDPLYITWDILIPLPAMVLGWLYIWGDLTGFGTNDGIGHAAHIGGYFSVLLLLFLFHDEDRKKLFKGIIINVVSAVVLFVGLLFL